MGDNASRTGRCSAGLFTRPADLRSSLTQPLSIIDCNSLLGLEMQTNWSNLTVCLKQNYRETCNYICKHVNYFYLVTQRLSFIERALCYIRKDRYLNFWVLAISFKSVRWKQIRKRTMQDHVKSTLIVSQYDGIVTVYKRAVYTKNK